jgi:isopentenyl-diphosphate Delta-isomerase
MTADVTVEANVNEIRDYKYVDKAELQAMFEEEGTRNLKCSLLLVNG